MYKIFLAAAMLAFTASAMAQDSGSPSDFGTSPDVVTVESHFSKAMRTWKDRVCADLDNSVDDIKCQMKFEGALSEVERVKLLFEFSMLLAIRPEDAAEFEETRKVIDAERLKIADVIAGLSKEYPDKAR